MKCMSQVGLYAKSALYKNIDLVTGNPENSYRFENDIFAEGSVVFNEKLYVLTYRENSILVFNPETLELENSYYYEHRGWGLTTDGEYLIASDGSSKLYFMDEKLNIVKEVTVTNNDKEINKINELEYIDGYIWANIWQTNNIIIIDKQTGNVVKTIDFTDLYNKSNDIDDVLNGIAYNEETNKIYITGKRWDTLFEFELK